MAIGKVEKDLKMKKRRRHSSLDFNDSYKRQKFLCQYYDSILPSGQGSEIISRPSLKKGDDPENYQYNEDYFWMTYFVHQHQLLLQVKEIKEHNLVNTQASADITELKNFLRVKAFYEEIETNFLQHVSTICKASISKLLRELRSQGYDIQNNDIDISTRLMKIQQKLPSQYNISTSDFNKFLDYVHHQNAKEKNKTNEELMTEAFMKLLIWSDSSDKHQWFLYFDNDVNKFFDQPMVDNQHAVRIINFAKRLGEKNGFEDGRLKAGLSEEEHLFITGYSKKLLDFTYQLINTRNEVKHETFASTEMLNDILQKFDPKNSEENNNNIVWQAKSLFTDEFSKYLKKILLNKYAGEFHNQRMEGLKFALTTDDNLHNYTIYNLTDIQFNEKKLRNDTTYGPFKMPNHCRNDEEFLIDLMQTHFDLLKNFISGFVQAFVKLEYWNQIHYPKEEHYLKAEQTKMYIAYQVLQNAVIAGKHWMEHLTLIYREELENLLVKIRLAAVKGSDMSQARKDVQQLCRYLQDIINNFKREIKDLETKLLLVNFLESVKTVLQHKKVQLNYHLIHYCLNHTEFNQYLVNLLKTTGNISAEQFKKHFFQLGLYSGFEKRDEERSKMLNESSRYNYILKFNGKVFKSYLDSMRVMSNKVIPQRSVPGGKRKFFNNEIMTNNLDSDVAKLHNELKRKKITRAALEGFKEKLRQQGIVDTMRHKRSDISLQQKIDEVNRKLRPQKTTQDLEKDNRLDARQQGIVDTMRHKRSDISRQQKIDEVYRKSRQQNNDEWHRKPRQHKRTQKVERDARPKKDARELGPVDIMKPGNKPKSTWRHESRDEYFKRMQKKNEDIDAWRKKSQQQKNPVNNKPVVQTTSVSHIQNAPQQYAPQYIVVDQYGRQIPAFQYGQPTYQQPFVYQQPIAVNQCGQQVATNHFVPVQSYYQQLSQPAHVIVPQSTSANNTNPAQSKGVSSRRKLLKRKLSSCNMETQLQIYKRKIHKYEEKIQRLDEIINGSDE